METRQAVINKQLDASKKEQEKMDAARKEEEEKEAARKARKLKKRQAGLFVHKDNKIRRNDIITDLATGKIKFETDNNIIEVEVKQEALELLQEGTSDIEMWEDDLVSNVDAGEDASTTAGVTASPQIAGTALPAATVMTSPPPPAVIDSPPMITYTPPDVIALSGTVIASSSVQSRIEILQTQVRKLQKDLQAAKSLMELKDVTNESQAQRISQLEGNLARKEATIRDMGLEMEKMKEAAEEKEVRNQQLNRALVRKEKIQNYVWTATKKTTTPLQTPEETALQLLPDVLKIFIQWDGRIDDRTVHWRKLLPLLTTCRLVCKSWKASVDLVMQQDSSHLDLNSSNRSLSYHKQDFTPSPLRISFDNFDDARWTDKLELIWRELGRNADYNPIPSRHLMISSRLQENSDYSSGKWTNYCQMVRALLKVAGEKVWYLTVDFDGGNGFNDSLVDCMVVYRCLSEWFSLLPKLRSLAYTTMVMPTDKWRKELEKIPFPEFKHLQTVAFGGVAETHLNYTILNNNRNVKRLRLSPRSSPSPVAMELDLPNLTSLKGKFFCVEDWTKFANEARWKLEDLSVEFLGLAKPTALEFAEGVAKFGDTLKSLAFNLSEIGMGTGEDLELHLSQLKSLHVSTGDREGVSLPGLLVSLKSLETFSLEVSVRLGVFVPPQCINQNIYFDYLYNFRQKFDWTKLPNLRSVKLTVKFNGREIGEQEIFVVRRNNRPPVKFSIPKMSK